MHVAAIDTALWTWRAYYDEWQEDVGCVYCETSDGAVLIDPLVPGDEDAARFWTALDRDVEKAGGRVHVFLTVFWHARSSREMVERYDARLWAPTRGRGAIERRVGRVSDAYRPGDPLPGGVEARPTARAAEVVFWIPQHAALVAGDVLLGDAGGGVRLCPEAWLPEKTDVAALAESLRPLLELPLERILVSHGEPVLERGRDALAAALSRS